MATVIFCDHCGQKLDSAIRVQVSIKLVPETAQSELGGDFELAPIDLCLGCVNNLRNKITGEVIPQYTSFRANKY